MHPWTAHCRSRSPAVDRPGRAPSGSPRSSRTPASASTSPTTCSSSSGRPSEGWHDARVDAVRPAHARPGHRRPALRAGDLRGHEGLPARRTARSGPSARRRTPRGWCARAHRLALPGARRSRTSSPPSTRWSAPTSAGCRSRRGRRASTSGRSCSPPRRSSGCGPRQHVTYMVIASPAGAYFPRALKPVSHLADRGLHPRRPRRHGRGQDRRQLRQLAGRPAGGDRRRAATRWCSSTPPSGTYVEELGGMNLYFVHDDGTIVTPGATGTILEGITRALDHRARAASSATRSRSAGSPSTSGATASPPAGSPRSSPAAPRPSSRPVGTPEVGRRRGRRRGDGAPAGHAGDPAGARRHPVRPRRGHLRLDAPGRLNAPGRVMSPLRPVRPKAGRRSGGADDRRRARPPPWSGTGGSWWEASSTCSSGSRSRGPAPSVSGRRSCAGASADDLADSYAGHEDAVAVDGRLVRHRAAVPDPAVRRRSDGRSPTAGTAIP